MVPTAPQTSWALGITMWCITSSTVAIALIPFGAVACAGELPLHPHSSKSTREIANAMTRNELYQARTLVDCLGSYECSSILPVARKYAGQCRYSRVHAALSVDRDHS